MVSPEFPIFIPSKGRFAYPLTIKALTALKIPFYVIVEKPQEKDYRAVLNPAFGQVLVLPDVNRGVTVARNFIWDYAQNVLKTPFFWMIDDNIAAFGVLQKNARYQVQDGFTFHLIENFVQRYENIYMSGMQYHYFAPQKEKINPLIFNARIYSTMLIKTDIPFRFRSYFNEDTVLSLDILKAGYCTALFNQFIAFKRTTLTMKGGNTEQYQQTDRRKEFVQDLMRYHPDVTKMVWRYNRWHHEVDYSRFRNNMPILKEGGYEPPKKTTLNFYHPE
jgi:hypothetical protein